MEFRKLLFEDQLLPLMVDIVQVEQYYEVPLYCNAYTNTYTDTYTVMFKITCTI